MTQPTNGTINPSDQPNPIRSLGRKLLIELSIYLVLIVLYFIIVKMTLDNIMNELFYENLGIYALLGMGLIVFQGVVLEIISSFLANRITMDRSE